MLECNMECNEKKNIFHQKKQQQYIIEKKNSFNLSSFTHKTKKNDQTAYVCMCNLALLIIFKTPHRYWVPTKVFACEKKKTIRKLLRHLMKSYLKKRLKG